MNACVFSVIAVVLLLLGSTRSVAQTQEDPLLKLQLNNGGAVYGRIVTTDAKTVTIATIWYRNLVVFRADIAEITHSTQTPEEIFREIELTLYDRAGSSMTGHILSVTQDTIHFETSSGIPITIPQELIYSVAPGRGGWHFDDTHEPPEYNEPAVDYGYWMKDRLFFMPTAQLPAAGEVYSSLNYFVVPVVTIGMHRYASMNIGLSLTERFHGEQMFVFGPRVRVYEAEDYGISLAYTALISYENTEQNDQVLQSVVTGTYGMLTGTVGLGWGMYDEQSSGSPFIHLGADIRLSDAVHVISEFVSTGETKYAPLLFLGMRLIGARMGADLAFVTNTDEFGANHSSQRLEPYFCLYYHF